ncbi:MAG: acyltransferase [Clostridia bacterium]|nr:acyltransferase [Clostridia bacterium]
MTGKRQWIPELDGLRVLMIFLVSWYHIWQQSWLTPVIGGNSLDPLLRSGYIWVDGTVLMSAFLLYRPYAAARLRQAPLPEIRAFYHRRARRILPGYYTILALTFFGICLPYGLYSSPQFLVKDLATHLTFLFPFFGDTYLSTPLGAACWTLAIEVQAYALFPWVARASLKHPGRVFGGMVALCLGFRAWCLWSLTDFNLVVNQLINFLDLYALGCGLAWTYERLQTREQERGSLFRGSGWVATAVFLLACWGLSRMIQIQAASSVYTVGYGLGGWISRGLRMAVPSSNYPVIQRNQMIYRPAYGLLFGAMMLSAPFSLKPLRKLLGNRVTHFLAGVSMNYYLAHQTVIVHMRRIGFPNSEYEYPNQAGDRPWQLQYTLWAFGLSLAAAIAITYLAEKPIQRWLDRRAAKNLPMQGG